VVFHGGGTDENPGDLLDYCGIDGSILDYNYENQIREKLTFNPDYAEFPCPIEKIRNGEIPTLEEVLADAKRKNNDKLKRYRKMHIKIELKGPDVVEDVLALVDSLGVASMCSYSSFDLQKLMKVRELRPGRDPKTGEYMYKTGALFNNIDGNGKILDDDYSPIHSVSNWNDCDIIDRALAVGASEIHLKYDPCKKPLIDRIHSSGLGSMAWFRGPIGMNEDCSIKYKDVGNEDFAMYEVMLQTGVQQLCVNKPDVLIALRENLFLQQQVQRKQQLVLL
jgi:glycerophosphoryl diester phosphodiesterase